MPPRVSSVVMTALMTGRSESLIIDLVNDLHNTVTSRVWIKVDFCQLHIIFL